MKQIFIALCMLVMGGCATVQMGDAQMDAKLKNFVPPKDRAALYLYRNETFGAAIKMTVVLDGKILGDTASMTYLYTELEPGKHRLVSKTENDSTLDFEAIVGKIYYVWQEVKMGLWQARSHLQMMDEKTGQAGVIESQLAVAPQ